MRTGTPVLLALAAIWLVGGCVPKVQIPNIKQCRVISSDHDSTLDADAHADMLLGQLYQLMKANEGIEVPLCTADQDTKQCLSDRVRVFVLGGIIPGIGSRSCYVFSKISLGEHQLTFSKDNRKTKFIGTPMFCRENQCRAYVKDGGLVVEMTNYYSNWAAVGNSTMAEGWAIDFIDFDSGMVGLQLELDIKGIMVAGGGSKYVMLKFPKIPEYTTTRAGGVGKP